MSAWSKEKNKRPPLSSNYKHEENTSIAIGLLDSWASALSAGLLCPTGAALRRKGQGSRRVQ
jgi:hypothetical protein